jgi:hypothetical protein
LAAVCRVQSSAVQRSAHDSGCRLAWGLDVHPYVSAPALTGPKVQRRDGAVVGPARSAVRVSPKKPSRSRPVVRPGWPVSVT